MKPEHRETARTVCAMVCAVPETLHHQLWCAGLEWHYCLLYRRFYCCTAMVWNTGANTAFFFNTLYCRLKPPYKTKHCLDWTVGPSALKQLRGNGSHLETMLQTPHYRSDKSLHHNTSLSSGVLRVRRWDASPYKCQSGSRSHFNSCFSRLFGHQSVRSALSEFLDFLGF